MPSIITASSCRLSPASPQPGMPGCGLAGLSRHDEIVMTDGIANPV